MIVNASPETEYQIAQLATQNGQPVADFTGSLPEEKLYEAAARHTNGSDDLNPNALTEAVQKLFNHTKEKRKQARTRLLQQSRSLPENQIFIETVCGKWPGNKTDGQIAQALHQLS